MTDRYEHIRNLQAERDALLDALRQITEWPDGGNRYGQENIKRFAQAAEIEALRAEAAEWKRAASEQAELRKKAEARADNLATALRNCQKLARNCYKDELPSAIITTASKAVAEYDMLRRLRRKPVEEQLGTIAKIILREHDNVDQAIRYAKRMAQRYADSRSLMAMEYLDAAQELEAWAKNKPR